MNHTLLRYYSSFDLELQHLLQAISRASIEIQRYVRYHAIYQLDQQTQKNASGEDQQPLDVISNTIMITQLLQSKSCNILLSEENEKPIRVPQEYKGKYLVAFDPLDGSSNIECNGPVGTIFSIYENKKEEILISGHQIKVAGYVLYGPATEMIIAANHKVDRFVMDSFQKYEHIETIRLEGRNKRIYSINEANQAIWGSDIKQWIDGYKQPYTKYTARYIGSMVGDVHRTLCYGGVFCYPADKKNPNGKLRLLYECFPMAYIIETAGGKAIVGNASTQRILDVVPTAVHQRTPILMGTIEEVNRYRPLAKL